MRMTNQEFATELRKLADFYDANTEAVQPSSISIYLSTKTEVMAAALAFKPIKKSFDGMGESDYGTLQPLNLPIVRIRFPRSSVCKKTVSWDCEPLLAPEDEAKLEEAAAVEAAVEVATS